MIGIRGGMFEGDVHTHSLLERVQQCVRVRVNGRWVEKRGSRGHVALKGGLQSSIERIPVNRFPISRDMRDRRAWKVYRKGNGSMI